MVKRYKKPKTVRQEDNPSPFRLAERKYKFYKQPKSEPDFSEVLDFWDLSNNTPENRALIQLHSQIFRDRELNVYSLSNRPGLLIIPKALHPEEQIFYANRCVTEYPLPPNHTNLGFLPDSYWIDYLRKQQPEASVMEKLRWVTLGYHYNWTKNIYDPSPEWYSEFPDMIAKVSEKFARLCGHPDFVAEAGIINYYHVNDTMMKAHQDESEFTFDQPIVSFSIGSTAIFLIGGINSDEAPSAMYLRSGDIVIMGGHSRVCFHGVPRILPDSLPEDLQSYCQVHSASFSDLYEYLKQTRVNINVRQVFPDQEKRFLSDEERKQLLAKAMNGEK